MTAEKIWHLIVEIGKATILVLFSVAVNSVVKMSNDLTEVKVSIAKVVTQMDENVRTVQRQESEIHDHELRILKLERKR